MKIARISLATRRAVRAWRAQGLRIGFVPTMGALHDGHRSLLARARRECDRVAASVFVNPLQFGPREDFARYPRPLEKDLAILRAEKTDLVYLPDAAELYPEGFDTRVQVRRVGRILEGRSRPGHFEGVATVVAKLLIAVEPDRLYLGQKDAQQAVVLKRMIADLDFGTAVVLCPTIREEDGLALSSRNAYLKPEERKWAPALYAALKATAASLASGELSSAKDAERDLRRRLRGGPGRLDYARAIDAETFGPPQDDRPWVLALAYRMRAARLIDNLRVMPGARRAGVP